METHVTYRHLWDGTEPGWSVLEHTEDREEVRILFAMTGPTLVEIKALRTIDPVLADTASEVLAHLRGTSYHSLGTHESMSARRMKQRCAAAGLRVEARPSRHVRRGLFNRATKHYLLIEDEAVLEAVVQEALRRGLPVIHSTA